MEWKLHEYIIIHTSIFLYIHLIVSIALHDFSRTTQVLIDIMKFGPCTYFTLQISHDTIHHELKFIYMYLTYIKTHVSQ